MCLGNEKVFMEHKLIHHYKNQAFRQLDSSFSRQLFYVNFYIIGKYLHLILLEFLSSPSSCLDLLLTNSKGNFFMLKISDQLHCPLYNASQVQTNVTPPRYFLQNYLNFCDQWGHQWGCMGEWSRASKLQSKGNEALGSNPC